VYERRLDCSQLISHDAQAPGDLLEKCLTNPRAPVLISSTTFPTILVWEFLFNFSRLPRVAHLLFTHKAPHRAQLPKQAATRRAGEIDLTQDLSITDVTAYLSPGISCLCLLPASPADSLAHTSHYRPSLRRVSARSILQSSLPFDPSLCIFEANTHNRLSSHHRFISSDLALKIC
jgi:hypothetical protein